MTVLVVFPEDSQDNPQLFHDFDEIANYLRELGALFERWETDVALDVDADQETILKAYHGPVERLKKLFGFQSADVVSVTEGQPQKEELRAKFLNEHTHSDFEVRFFVEGRGLFYIHHNSSVYALLCEKGDLLSVPTGLRHWFDLGAEPDLKCIRLFTTPEGWLADFTGDPISQHYPGLEDFRRIYP